MTSKKRKIEEWERKKIEDTIQDFKDESFREFFDKIESKLERKFNHPGYKEKDLEEVLMKKFTRQLKPNQKTSIKNQFRQAERKAILDMLQEYKDSKFRRFMDRVDQDELYFKTLLTPKQMTRLNRITKYFVISFSAFVLLGLLLEALHLIK
jgi:hypothetical protein